MYSPPLESPIDILFVFLFRTSFSICFFIFSGKCFKLSSKFSSIDEIFIIRVSNLFRYSQNIFVKSSFLFKNALPPNSLVGG